MIRTIFLLAPLALVFSCDDKGSNTEECSSSSDIDSDGIDDCTEDELGTDPESADSDGDGFSDLEEVDCISDPNNAEEMCYTCGWAHNDPGTLDSTGSDIGDTIDNFALIDQCGEEVDIHDFYEEYHILYLTAAW